MSETRTPTLGEFEERLIHRKVRQMTRRSGFRQQDHDDLFQDLFVKLLRALPKFDPARGCREAFVATVVHHAVASLVRDREASLPPGGHVLSLQRRIATDDGETELGVLLGHHEHDARRLRHPRTDEDLAQLTSDVQQVLSDLPERLRTVAESLMSRSVSRCARDVGLSRTTVRRMVGQLRKRFTQSGLQDYL